MTTADTRAETELRVHAVYSELSYNIDMMPRYFGVFASLWHQCLRLVEYRTFGLLPKPQDETDPEVYLFIPQSQGTPRLVVRRLHIGSPMEITFAVEGGTAFAGAYVTYVFVRALRSPDSIGSWLPRLVAGWHQGLQSAEHEKSKRRTGRLVSSTDPLPAPEEVPQVKGLIRTSKELLELHMFADEVLADVGDVVEARLADPNAP